MTGSDDGDEDEDEDDDDNDDDEDDEYCCNCYSYFHSPWFLLCVNVRGVPILSLLTDSAIKRCASESSVQPVIITYAKMLSEKTNNQFY